MPSRQHEEVVALVRAGFGERAEVETFAEARARLDLLAGVLGVPQGIEVTPVQLAGVACERLRPPSSPSADPARRLLYLHGGSYTAGSLNSHRGFAGRLSAACNADVVLVDYRLAPEHPHPAGLDDALGVYRRLLDEHPDTSNLFVAGDSAGGGLVAALLLALRDSGQPLPAGAVLFSPWLDLTLTAGAVTAVAAADPMLRATALARSARAYAGDDLRRPLVSPVFADLAGLPPVLVFVGTAEILLDDSRTFAARAAAAGVDVELEVGEGLIHVWPAAEGGSPRPRQPSTGWRPSSRVRWRRRAGEYRRRPGCAPRRRLPPAGRTRPA